MKRIFVHVRGIYAAHPRAKMENNPELQRSPPHLDSPSAFLFLSTSSKLRLSCSDLRHLFTLETREHGLQTHVCLQGGKGQNTISVPLPKPKNDWVRHQNDNKDSPLAHRHGFTWLCRKDEKQNRSCILYVGLLCLALTLVWTLQQSEPSVQLCLFTRTSWQQAQEPILV